MLRRYSSQSMSGDSRLVKEEIVDLCRICESMENLIDMSSEKFSHLSEKLHQFANFAGNFSYMLNYICVSCSAKLEDAFDFKIQCENTYKILICRMGTNRADPLFSDPLDDARTNIPHKVQVKTEDKYFDVFQVDEFQDHGDSDRNSTEDSHLLDDIKKEDSKGTVKPKRKSLGKKQEKKRMKRLPENTEFVIDKKCKYVCAICGKAQDKKCMLRNHIIRIHVKETPYECDMCDRKFSLRLSLNNHKLTHRDSKIPCNICGKTFKNNAYMKKHLKQVHSKPMRVKVNAGSLACETCGFLAKNRTTLLFHLKRHSGIKPFKCDVCDKRFLRKMQLKRHSTLHTGERPYLCHLCSKSFKVRPNLNSHMMSHTGEKKYKCAFCDKPFQQSYALKMHVQREHLDEPRYECPKCLVKFRKKKVRTIHAKTCNGEPPKEEPQTPDETQNPDPPPDGPVRVITF